MGETTIPLSNTPSHNPLKQQAGKCGIAVGSSLTRRVTIAWHERPARESMGETTIPLSNTPSHNPLKQQAGKLGIAVGSSLTRRVTNAWHERPARESMSETRDARDANAIFEYPVSQSIMATRR